MKHQTEQKNEQKKKIELTPEQQKITDEYYENNASKIRQIVDKITSTFGGISDKDMDDFYSIANEVFLNIILTYDHTRDFRGYLYSCISNKLKTEMTRRNRKKNSFHRDVVNEDGKIEKEYVQDISYEGYFFGEDGSAPKDIIADDSNVREEMSDGMKKYVASLSDVERKVLGLQAIGYNSTDIQRKLNLTAREYYNSVTNMHSYQKMRNLREINVYEAHKTNNKEDNNMNMIHKIGETTKTYTQPISSVVDDVQRAALRDDHVLQRSPNQWSKAIKGELISDLLQGRSLQPIIVCEEKCGDYVYNWVIDGLQRISTIMEFYTNQLSIYKNVRVPLIEFQDVVMDENGKVVFDEYNNPVYKKDVCDIRGKKFSELPVVLQNTFRKYNISVLKELDCTKKEIAYNIARFNRCKPMNKAQLGFLGLEENFAIIVDQIEQMPFFKNEAKSNFKVKDVTSSAIKRTIVETVMVINFLDDWKKETQYMTEYLSENACDAHFTDICVLLERLNVVSNKTVAHMFTSKDAFIWFAIFDAFTYLNIEDSKFIEFMSAVDTDLSEVVVNDTTWKELCASKGTKDKGIVVKKINFLTSMMNKYFEREDDIEFNTNDEKLNAFVEEYNTKDCVKIAKESTNTKSNTKLPLVNLLMAKGEFEINNTTIQELATKIDNGVCELDANDYEDILFYADMLDDWFLELKYDIAMEVGKYVPELIAFVQNVCEAQNDELAQKWFVDFANNGFMRKIMTDNRWDNLTKMMQTFNAIEKKVS